MAETEQGDEDGARHGLSRWWKSRSTKGKMLWSALAVFVLLIVIGAAAGGSSNSTKTTSMASGSVAKPPPEPSVQLHLNQGSFSQTGSQARLTGTVTPGAAVTVNEHPGAVYGSDWHGTAQHLHVGENTIVVSASLTGHQSAEDTITVTRHHTQAEVDSPILL
jgi:hypothetical protein